MNAWRVGQLRASAEEVADLTRATQKALTRRVNEGVVVSTARKILRCEIDVPVLLEQLLRAEIVLLFAEAAMERCDAWDGTQDSSDGINAAITVMHEEAQAVWVKA